MRIYIFKLSIFVEQLSNIEFFRVVLLQILFGSGAALIRIRIHNTASHG
jgi:hypothetical protein